MVSRILVSFIICQLSCFVSAFDQYINALGDYRESPRMDAGRGGADAGYDGGQRGYGRGGFGNRDTQGGYGGLGGGGGAVGRGYDGGEGGVDANAFAQGYDGYRGAGGRGYGRGEGTVGFGNRDTQGGYGGFGGGGGAVGRGFEGGEGGVDGNAFAQGYDGYRGAGRGYGGGEGGNYRGAQDETEGIGSPMRSPYGSPPGPPQGAEDLGYGNVRERRPSFGNKNYGGDGAAANAYIRRRIARRYGDMPVSRNERSRVGYDRISGRNLGPDDNPLYNERGEKILGVQYSLSEVIEVMRQCANRTMKTAEVEQLLDTFQRVNWKFENKIIGPLSEVQSRKRNIIINIEGTFRDVTINIATMVAKRLGAEVSLPPAASLNKFKAFFTSNNNPELKRVYFGLNYYAMTDEIKGIIRTVPIILTGYWMDHCAYGLIKYYDEPPEGNSSAYAWPKDLVKPDLLFFLNLPDPITARQISNFYKIKLTNIFRRLQNPKAIEINSTANGEEVISLILKHVNNLIDDEEAEEK